MWRYIMKASEVINIAQNEIGYLEKANACNLYDKKLNAGKNNYTKYWQDLKPSYQGQYWCLAFVVWCFVAAFCQQTAKYLLNMTSGYDFYTPTCGKAFYDKKQWFTSPKVGDLIFFCSESAKKEGRWKGIHHVGLVYKISDKYVYTIEGNTSNGSEVIPNGGAVCDKKYLLTDKCIAGYGRPKYDVEDEYDVSTIDCGRDGLTIKCDSLLNVRNAPVNGDVVKTYKNGENVKVTGKVNVNGTWWFKNQDGYFSSKYCQGWILESCNRWWYVKKGYTYDSLKVVQIDNKYYAFDKDGWLITPDYINSDGSIK